MILFIIYSSSAPALQSYFPSAPSNVKLNAMEESVGCQEHEVTASSSNEDQDREGEIEGNPESFVSLHLSCLSFLTDWFKPLMCTGHYVWSGYD